MPVVLRSHGFVVSIYAPPREHPPPHVHIGKAAGWVVVALDPVVAIRGRMQARDAVFAVRLVEDNMEWLLAAWRKLHG